MRPPRAPALPPLPLLEDPADQRGLFFVRRVVLLTVLLIAALAAGMALAGSLVRVSVPVPGEARRESLSLGTYVLRQLRHGDAAEGAR
jgi:hypothetical protein